MRISILIAVVVLLFSPAIQNADACTVFVLDDGPRHYYGSNFDWHIGMGYVMVNPRGVTKHGWPLPEDPGRPAQWQSIFGSVTFVQYGQGLPKGGINEAGLVIEGLLLIGSAYPPPDHRPYIGSTSQLKQYILDTCGTVAEVLDHLARVRPAVNPWAPGVHFMVADATGDCAVIAFEDGAMKVYRGDDLPVKVLVNQDYAGSIAAQSAPPNLDADFMAHTGGRFQTVSKRLKKYRSTSGDRAVVYAMDTLERAAAGQYTQWRVVYDQHARRAYWRCGPDETLRWLDLSQIDFDCRRPATAMPVQQIIAGQANGYLSRYTLEDNRRVVCRALAQSRDVIRVPEALWEEIWRWPQKEVCAAK